jgi:hypothetical protein
MPRVRIVQRDLVTLLFDATTQRHEEVSRTRVSCWVEGKQLVILDPSSSVAPETFTFGGVPAKRTSPRDRYRFRLEWPSKEVANA